MNVIPYHSPLPFSKATAVAIGYFDGVHCGHQKIIAHMVQEARRQSLESVVMTFDPHPVTVLQGGHPKALLTHLKHKLYLMEQCGVDHCVIVNFTTMFSQMDPEDFVKEYLVQRLKAQWITVGFNYRFGRARKGDSQLLKKLSHTYSFGMEVVSPVYVGGEIVSSSRIRDAVMCGDLDHARQMLGRPLMLMGRVIHGDGKGKEFGFPTINLALYNDVVPPLGVYYVDVDVKGATYHGLLNIGHRPSFLGGDCGEQAKVEVHILDFSDDVYEQVIRIHVLDQCRLEMSFANAEGLIQQIQTDVVQARTYFSECAKGTKTCKETGEV